MQVVDKGREVASQQHQSTVQLSSTGPALHYKKQQQNFKFSAEIDKKIKQHETFHSISAKFNLLAKSIDTSSKIFSHMTIVNSINTCLLKSLAEPGGKKIKSFGNQLGS